MTKRSNEDAHQSEPAAKRSHAAESQQDLLLRAQACLDRLDYKTTEEICSSIIEAGTSDMVQPLMIRSVSLGKRGLYSEAVQDVEKALESKKSLETHLRAAFAYLGMVQHHINLAKAFSVQGNAQVTAQGNVAEPLLSTNVDELEYSIQEARNLEKRGSFKRVSPELFIKIISFCDSPSLAMASSVSKQWRRKILSDEELFRSFTMRGHPVMISLGLELFQKRCKNTIHSVDLQVSDVDSSKYFVTCNLTQSVHTLRSLKVAHHGELGPTLWKLAEKCKSLSVFSSSRLGNISAVKIPPLDAAVALVGPSWADHQQFERFQWNCGESNLECNDGLLTLLQNARGILINSNNFSQTSLIKLLSSNTSLVDLRIPSMDATDNLLDIPRLNLPNLEILSLPWIPSVRRKQEHLFFRQLYPPSLQYLKVGHLEKPSSLSSFSQAYSLHSLMVGLSGISPGLNSPETSASQFISSIDGCNTIRRLDLHLQGEGSSVFAKTFLALCTPYSKETIQGGWKDSLVFPDLRSVKISSTQDAISGYQVTVDGFALTSFVAARKAVNRRVSLANVLLSANGHFTASEEPAASPPIVLFENDEAEGELLTSSMIEEIDIKHTAEDSDGLEEEQREWLSINLLRFKHPYPDLFTIAKR